MTDDLILRNTIAAEAIHIGVTQDVADDISALLMENIAEIERLRAGLEFYAAGHADAAIDDFEPHPEQPFKRGARARAALAEKEPT